MGCELVVDDGDLEAVLELFRERERIFSRFVPDSELNRVNAAASPVVGVSAELARGAPHAIGAAAATGGLVEPTVGAALLASGYDDDFDRLEPTRGPPGRRPPAAGASFASTAGCSGGRPALVLDLNGVVKSQAVDDALAASGARLVSAGGDLAVSRETAVALPGGGESRSGAAASRRAGRRSAAGSAAASGSTT